MPPLHFAGHDFRVAGGKALFWPLRAALIVADLHLEKASWFAARGQMLPPHDSLATLSALAALVTETGAREVWCLGDNFHDSAGAARLSGDARATLVRLTGALDWVWITGNHDEALPETVGGRVIAEAEVDGLMLRHHADPADQRPELSGHFHPKHSSAARGRRVTRPCFVEGARKLILPSFGALTGGMAATHPEIIRSIGGIVAIHVPAGDRVARFAA
ncbi:ligase-associated DNA damage response endonuclease PdeM [Chakrabartia godavariana]|nr:ligase-associated DNA damage response endonuclease PdeM [Chakrabartia godavariana]